MEKLKNITLINADCMEVIKSMPDNAFDLAICDPPYGIGEDGSKNSSRGCITKAKEYHPFFGNDKEPPKAEYFNELFRVSKNQIVFGANHFISRMPFDSSCWIVWDKDNGLSDFADCELAWTSFDKAVRKFRYKWQGMLQENMKNKEVRIHPTQKPVALYGWLLNKFANPGDKILDTHLGSGSICIAAHDLGFEMTGIELDKEYFELAKKRLEYHQRQGKLF
jgi:site-specific DNA-methyltransferase (adenine-specific)